MTFGLNPVRGTYLMYSVIDKDGVVKTHCGLDLPKPVFMHDFAISPRYTLFMDLPVTFHLLRAFNGKPCSKFNDEQPARFGITPRHGSNTDVKWFNVSSCFFSIR